jgi:DNA-binding MarR family transcriptional regulator
MQTRQPAADALLSALMTVGRLMRQRQADDQLDPGMFWLLKTIAHKGPMRISDLATAVHLDVSTVSRHVAQVERTGLVARTADPADGRAQLVGITDDGQQLLDQAFQRRRDLLESTLSGWEPDDIVEFERLLGKFVSGINSQTSKDPA